MNSRRRVWWLVVAALFSGTGIAAAAAPGGSLDVDEAVRIALRQNYAYRQSVAGVGVASGSRLDALAGLLPSVTGSASYSRVDQTSAETATEVNGIPVPPLELPTDLQRSSEAAGLSLRQDLSFPRWFQYRSAQSAVRAAQHGVGAAAQNLAFDVRQQFYLVLRAQDLLQVQKEDLRLAGDEERRINSMFELGSVARVDVLKARVRVADAEVALISQQNQVAIERARLATLLGLAPDSQFDLVGDLGSGAAPIDSAQAVSQSEMRPDLLQAKADLGSASNQYKSALWSRFPSVFASFDVNTSSGTTALSQINFNDTGDLEAFSFESDSNQDGWTFRIGASVNLDAFLNMGSHSRTRATRRQAELDVEGRQLEIRRELEEAILNYRASASAIDAANRGVEAAAEDLRLSEERYRQGLGTVLELLEAQVNLTRARNTLVNAQTGLKISGAAVEKARGAPLPG